MRPDREDRPSISAAERWLKISKNVYARVQQRGFVGGDPLEDLSEATREVDSEYSTDVRGLLSLTDPAELMDQFRSLFAGYGLGKRSLDRLLDMNRDALEKLASANRNRKNDTEERGARGASLLRGAADEAIQTLQSMVHRAETIDELAHLPGQPTQAAAHLLNRLRLLANSAGELERGEAPGDDTLESLQGMEIHGAVVKAYDGMTPAELAEAPVAALKGVSRVNSDKLKTGFGMQSIRDMAENPFLLQAAGIVTLADEEASELRPGASIYDRSFTALADAPVSRLEGIGPRQARVLCAALRIRTIRDLADSRYFRVARAIVTLADLKT